VTADLPRPTAATASPVRIVGSGLLGASLGLALRSAGVDVQLADTSPVSLALARDLGAGTIPDPAADAPEPALVVVATPPDVAASVVRTELAAHPGAVVTDIASVKAVIAAEVLEGAPPADAARYVGSHPMAGRERSGASGADADLFAGRPWVVVPTESSSPAAVAAARSLASDVGSFVVQMGAAEHDRAVAVVSHLPQVLSSVLASRLNDADETALDLAGQGLRDTTRIAAADSRLWTAILTGNAAALRDELVAVRESLDRVIRSGNDGAARIPGKHGGAPGRYTEVTVLVPDNPGALGRLFGEVGEAGVNIEDLGIEHSAGQRVGLVRLSVVPQAAAGLEAELDRRGWRVVAR
jgi:prephenate dehydrogenase